MKKIKQMTTLQCIIRNINHVTFVLSLTTYEFKPVWDLNPCTPTDISDMVN